MKNNNFEDQFKEAFSAYEPNLSTNEIWDNVEPHLKKKKKRRFLFFWWFLGGLGLALLGFGLAQWLPNEPIIATPIPEGVKDNVPTLNPVALVDEECPEVKSDLNISLASTPKKQSIASNLKETKVYSFIATAEKSLTELPSEVVKSNRITNTTSNKITSNTTKPEQEIIEEKVISSEENLKTKKSEKSDLEKTKKDKVLKEKPEKEKIKKKKLKKKKSKKSKEKTKKKKRIKPLRAKWKFHLQGGSGPVAPIKVITSNRNETFTNLRKENEKGLGGFTINSNFLAESPNGLVLLGGLEYVEFRERFRYEAMEEITTTSVGTVAIVENGQGEIIETISGPVTTTTTRTRKVRHTNKYRYFNFPVGIGKAWRNRKNYWKIYGGLDFNLGFSFNGKIITEPFTTNAPIRELISRGNRTFYSQYYRRKAGIGLWLSTEYSRPINNQLSWMIAPRIKLPFSNITALDYEIKQRYIPISVQIGINYLINPPKKKKQRSK